MSENKYQNNGDSDVQEDIAIHLLHIANELAILNKTLKEK